LSFKFYLVQIQSLEPFGVYGRRGQSLSGFRASTSLNIQHIANNFIFEFPCIISLYYIRNQLDATLAVLSINNCKNTLHVSDVHRVHHQEY